MDFKRITIIAGHYGSGKTNIAINLAYELKKLHENVAIADADIVNPYFRTKDSEKELHDAGIKLICSKYANSNVDIPALPQELYSITDDSSLYAIMDIGGDDRGAYALGRFSKKIVEENNYEMLAVNNQFRPLTMDAASAISVMREIEAAAKMRFTGIINNSNLGVETTKEDVLSSLPYAREVSEALHIPVKFTSVKQELYEELSKEIKNLFPLKLQSKIN